MSNSTNNSISERIGNRIYCLRKQKKLSREKLAFKIGISSQQLFKYETGQNKITIDRIVDIVNALDLEILDFFMLDDLNKTGDFLNYDGQELRNLTNQLSKLQTISAKDLVIQILQILDKLIK